MQDKQQVFDMLSYLKGSQFTEINNLNKVISFEDGRQKSNIYFLGGIKTLSEGRCSDDEISSKRYLFVDVDIRLTKFLNEAVVISDDQLMQEIEKVKNRLIETGFGDYYSMVWSGNGVHFYYTGNELEIDKATYSHGVQQIYKSINDILKPLGYTCDNACHNIARIGRLPGTINERIKKKNGESIWEIGPSECYIMEMPAVDCDFYDMLPEFAKMFEEEQGIKKIVDKYKPEPISNGSIRDQISKVNIADIAEEIRGVKIGNTNGDHTALKEENKNMGAYVYKPYNIIVNTGSSLIKTSDMKTFTPFQLVEMEMMNGDKKATVEYFKNRRGVCEVEGKNKSTAIIPPKKKYDRIGYVYGHEVFDKFKCMMSGELVVVVAPTNSGKTTFAMDILRKNNKAGYKGFCINLEFDIRQVAERNRLTFNGKDKNDLTKNLGTLTNNELEQMEVYIKNYLKEFDYHNDPNGMQLEDIIELIVKKNNEGYGLFIIDSFSRILGNLDSKTAHSMQNKSMEYLQALCQNLGVTIVLLHHTNKAGTHEGSQKIIDLANVFILIEISEDVFTGAKETHYLLSKDKFVNKIEVIAGYEKGKYIYK